MSDVYTRTTSGVGASISLKLNRYGLPQIGLQVVIVAPATYDVEGTLDDVDNPPSVGVTWFKHPVLRGLSANAQDNYAYPVRAIRINQTAGAGSTILSVLQAGLAGN